MTVAELILDEQLDQLDPLRHLRDDNDLDGTALVPAQPPSVQNQDIHFSFPTSHTPGIVTVKLNVDASPGCGGIAWPAGEVLSAYMSRRGSLEGKNVLELGGGTGLVGLIVGLLGANVWTTDQAPLLHVMKRNVAMNKLDACVHVRELNWGEPIPQDIPPLDIILAADCVYFEPAFPLLVKTLVDLTSLRDPEILFCYKKRRKADRRFFTCLKKEFSWTDVTDDPNRKIYSRDAISLLRLVRKR